MDKEILEKAKSLDIKIKAIKDSIERLNKLSKSVRGIKITDGYETYVSTDSNEMKKIVLQALEKERKSLEELEFQLDLL